MRERAYQVFTTPDRQYARYPPSVERDSLSVQVLRQTAWTISLFHLHGLHRTIENELAIYSLCSESMFFFSTCVSQQRSFPSEPRHVFQHVLTYWFDRRHAGTHAPSNALDEFGYGSKGGLLPVLPVCRPPKTTSSWWR